MHPWLDGLVVAVGLIGPMQGDSQTPAAELRGLTREIARHERALQRERRVRDNLLRDLEELGRREGWSRLGAFFKHRALGNELEDRVASLQTEQRSLLRLRARRESLLALSDALDWEHLDVLLADAASKWGQGLGEDPERLPAVVRALEAGGTAPGVASFERYRELVERLAQLNAVIARLPPEQESEVSANAPDRDSPEAQTAGDSAGGFLGVAERGPAGTLSTRASREVWYRLRSSLADEIVAVASELTRRARSSD
jgi:hypothetical protein